MRLAPSRGEDSRTHGRLKLAAIAVLVGSFAVTPALAKDVVLHAGRLIDATVAMKSCKHSCAP